MTEQQEKKVKKALLDFVNKEIFVFVKKEGADPIIYEQTKYNTLERLYGLFIEMDKYLHPPFDKEDKIVLK